jgi:hypothetical protein
MATRMLQRRGTASQWTSANTVLAAGEFGVETDTGQFKIGDGTTGWNSLAYFKDTIDLNIDLKAPLASPTFTGNVTLPSTTSIGDVSGTELALINGLTATAAELNVLDGITASTSELNILDGVTADASEINRLDGLLASTAELNTLVGIGTTSDIATKEYADTAVSDHNEDTTSVHGIADTSDLQLASEAATTYVAFEPSTTQVIKGNTRFEPFVVGGKPLTIKGLASQTGNLTEWKDSDDNVVAHVDPSGNIEATNLVVTGDLTVQGTTTTVNTTNYEIRDNMIYMNQAGAFALTDAVGNGTIVTYTAPGHDFAEGDYIVVTGVTPSGYNIAGTSLLTIDSVSGDDFVVTKTDTGTYVSGGTARGKSAANPDLGFAAGRTTGAGYGHTGLFRDATDATYKFFDGYTPEPDESLFIDTAHASFELAPIEVAAVTTTDLTATGDVDFTGATITGIDALPDQAGNNGKYLTTDGTDASWATLNASPAMDDLSDVTVTSATANDVVYYNGTGWVNKYVASIPTLTNAQSGTTYTLVLGDAGKIVEVGNSSSITVTIPTNAGVAYPVGTQITLLQTGLGQITVSGPSGGTLNATPGTKLRAQWSSATLLKRATDTWVLIGDLTA